MLCGIFLFGTLCSALQDEKIWMRVQVLGPLPHPCNFQPHLIHPSLLAPLPINPLTPALAPPGQDKATCRSRKTHCIAPSHSAAGNALLVSVACAPWLLDYVFSLCILAHLSAWFLVRLCALVFCSPYVILLASWFSICFSVHHA